MRQDFGMDFAAIEERKAELMALDRRVSDAAMNLAEKERQSYARIGQMVYKNITELDLRNTSFNEYFKSRFNNNDNFLTGILKDAACPFYFFDFFLLKQEQLYSHIRPEIKSDLTLDANSKN